MMKYIRLFLLMGLVLFSLPSAARAEAATLCVSPSGSDDNPGTPDAPLRTLEAAIARHRKEATDEGTAILLREGTYILSEPISLTYRDKKPLAIQSYPGETAVLSGGVPIKDWAETELHGETVWAAQVDARALRALYREEGSCAPARWPKIGVLYVRDVQRRDAAQPTHETQAQYRAFYADPADIPFSPEGAVMRMPHYWKDELTGVKAYDAETGRLSLNRRTSMTIAPQDPYWLENVLGAPLLPGEWAFDADTRTVYYAPLAGETREGATLYAGLHERLFTLDGAANVSFANITFARTGWSIPLGDSHIDFPQAAVDADACLYAANTKNLSFTRCAFRDLGAGAIRLAHGTKDVTVTRCTFENLGAHALYAHGKNLRDDPKAIERITFEDNLVSGYGRNFHNAVAVLLNHAAHCGVRYNEIHDGFYTAISAGWVWGAGFNPTDDVRIEHNLLYDIGQGMLSDMGGVYLLGTQKNTVVSGNIIHDVHAADYGGWGIYLDEGAGYITVENNLVYRCSAQGFHQHNGMTNTVRNNILAYSLAGQVGASDRHAKGTFTLESNLLVGSEPFFYRKYGKEKMDLGPNLFLDGISPFVDAEAGDFTLMDGLPYESVGFVPWAYEAGVRPE